MLRASPSGATWMPFLPTCIRRYVILRRQNGTTHQSEQSRIGDKGARTLIAANCVMIGMIIIHDTDHVRQAANWCYTISLTLKLVNLSVYAPSVIALAMAWFKWRGGAAMTIANGLLVGAGFSEVHLWRPSIPVWGIWNDNFFILGADRISWTILALTVLVATCVAMSGAYAMALNWAEQKGQMTA